MGIFARLPLISGPLGGAFLGAAATLAAMPAPAVAQAAATPPGFYLEAEGQRVFGDSDFGAGLVPPTELDVIGSEKKLGEGDGWGGAITLGYGWASGWSGAVRYRRLSADDEGGPVEPGLVAFAPEIPFAPGGIPFGVLGALTRVRSDASMVDVEIGKDLQVAGARLELFGGLTYAAIERDAAIIGDSCGCSSFALVMAHDFHGAGPKIGFRGGVPLAGGLSLVGSASIAALVGTSKFASRLDDPLFPAYQFKTEDHRTVAAIDSDVGLAFALGTGSLTVGYRVNAVLGALDTDQRVSPLFRELGFPSIGDGHDDFVEHGPFARFSLPLASLGD